MLRRKILLCSNLLTPHILQWWILIRRTLRPKQRRKQWDRPQRRLQKKKLMAELRRKSKMMEPKLRKSRFLETFTGTG
jgi:hypothetical protein